MAGCPLSLRSRRSSHTTSSALCFVLLSLLTTLTLPLLTQALPTPPTQQEPVPSLAADALPTQGTPHVTHSSFSDVTTELFVAGLFSNHSHRDAVVLEDGSPARIVTCLYSLTFQSDAGRFFAVAPESPYTDDYRSAIARDVQRLLTGSEDGNVTDDRSSSWSTTLSLFLHQDGTCTSATGTNTDSPTTSDSSDATLESALVNVVVVEKQVFARIDWVGAEIEVVYVLALSPSTTSTEAPDSEQESSDGGSSEASSSTDVHSTVTHDVDLALLSDISQTTTQTSNPPFVDLLAVLHSSHPFPILTDEFFKDKLTRRARDSRLSQVFLYPNLSLSDLFAAATADNTSSHTKAPPTYPYALTAHLEAIYGKEEPRCAGVSCVFAIIAIVLVMGLFCVAVIAFFVRLCQRRRQESMDGKRLMRLEEAAQTNAVSPSANRR